MTDTAIRVEVIKAHEDIATVRIATRPHRLYDVICTTARDNLPPVIEGECFVPEFALKPIMAPLIEKD